MRLAAFGCDFWILEGCDASPLLQNINFAFEKARFLFVLHTWRETMDAFGFEKD
jgi:hypothetical protein